MATSEKLGGVARRDVLRAGAVALGAGVAGWAASPAAAAATAPAARLADHGRILVVVELSGANDGLNTIVPYADDAYYRARPRLGIRSARLRKLDDRFAVQSGMAGFERLFKEGQLAIVHGCGYEQPSFSHFTSMAYWHTGAPHRGDAFGWLGRLADGMDPRGTADYLVNVEEHASLAVRARNHVPLVFYKPEDFVRGALFPEKRTLAKVAAPGRPRNPMEAFLFGVAESARHAEAHVREACDAYRTPIDYGLYKFGLERVAALIAADFPTRIYYVAFPNNAFDTHVAQADKHARILTYTSDHIAAFVRDMARIGRGDDVAVMVFSEFGRRVAENGNLGTDHGTAGPVFVTGAKVRGGHYGAIPSLTDLDDGNMRFTTDFRRVYATMIRAWMGYPDVVGVLKQDFAPFEMFAA